MQVRSFKVYLFCSKSTQVCAGYAYGNHMLKIKLKLLTRLPITIAMYDSALVLNKDIGLHIEERKLTFNVWFS